VYIKEIATGKVTRAIEEKEEPVKGYGWVNNSRLIFVMDKGGNENYHIYAANTDGGNLMDLTPFEGVRAMMLNELKDQKDYIIISMNKDNKQIFEPYKLNVNTGVLEKLFENDDPANPIQGYDFDKDGNLRGYTKMVDGVEMEYYYKDLQSGKFTLLKEMRWDDTFGIMSFNYASDHPDDAYVMTNLDSDKTEIVLYDLMPQLDADDMAEMKPITFKSRDGLTLHGYITLPKAALEGEKVPLVVNPHGGPQGIRDSWGFNPEAQLFASRGYATLQVNFRISGGYGKEFLRAGFKQIGREVMDDVEDGVKHVVGQGWVDPAKVAIYGGSHGGYATLMGLVKAPELYACGVDYVGISNIETFFASFPEYWKPLTEMAKEIWYDLDNPEETKIAREVSPVYQTDKDHPAGFCGAGGE